MKGRKAVFEVWIVKKLGDHIKPMLDDFDEKDGYKNTVVSAMWVGFNAGVELHDLIKMNLMRG